MTISTRISSTKCSSKRWICGNCRRSGTACAAYGSRSYRRRTRSLDFHAAEATYVDATIRATAHGHPHSSSWVISVGQWWTKYPRHPAHTTSRHPLLYRESDIEAVMILRDSGGAPFCSNGMLRIGYTFEISAIFAFGFACAQQLQHVIPRHRRLQWQDRLEGLHDIPPDCFYPTATYFRVVPESYGLRTLFHCSFIGTTVSLMDKSEI